MVFSRFAPVARTFAVTALQISLSALVLIGFQAASVLEAHAWPSESVGQHMTQPATPTPTATPTPKRYTNRAELLRDTDKFAMEKLGFEDENKNGIPDYRETYVVDKHDCTTVSAEFDYIVDQMGKAGVMDPAQAQGTVQIRGGNHAANIVPGIGIVDVTPMGVGNGYVASEGMPWYPFDRTGYTEYAVGFPDGGEMTFKGYNGPLTNTTPGATIRGSGGFGGGAAANLAMMGALSGLLQNGGFQPPPTTSGSSSGGGGVAAQPTPVRTPVTQSTATAPGSPNSGPTQTSTAKATPAASQSTPALDAQLVAAPDSGSSAAPKRTQLPAWDVSEFPPLVPRPTRGSLY